MPLDPQAQAVLDQLAALGAPPMQTLAPAVIRASMQAAPSEAGPGVARVEDRHIPGPAGRIQVRIYTPEGPGPFPVLLWFHGGGWVIGSISMSDATCRRLANQASCAVVSVDYRLAPEAKFPAAAEDCYAATAWVTQNASTFNGDGSKVAVGGDSAGGNLAAAVALMARDRGGPLLKYQVLIYPVIDRDLNRASYNRNANGYLLTREMMAWFWDLYLRDERDATNPYAAPLQARELAGVAPALIITAEFDPLLDEGEAYARRLAEAGVATTCRRYDGMFHGFFGMVSMIDKAKDAMAQVATGLMSAFDS